MKTLFFLLFILSSHVYAACDGKSETLSFNDPVNKTTFDIEGKVYRPESGNFPVVFILPPIVGETPLDGALGFNFCTNGIGAYILNVLNEPSSQEQIENLNIHEDTLIRAEFAVQKWIEKLSADPQVLKKYGIVGASQGGILSAYLAGAIPELIGSVIIAGSGNVAEVLATSTQATVMALREGRKSFFHLSSDDEYEDLVRPFITRDPLIVSKNVLSGSSMIFVLSLDTEVPTKNQKELVKSHTNPKVIEINNTHIPGIVEATTFRFQDILDFMKERLR